VENKLFSSFKRQYLEQESKL